MKQIYSLLLTMSIAYAAKAQPAIQWAKCLGGAYTANTEYSISVTADGGYVTAGYFYKHDQQNRKQASLKKIDASGNVTWQKTYGGFDSEIFYSVQQTTDGGYIMAGSSRSTYGGGISGHHGSNNSDCWVIKTDAAGNIQWQKSLGGTREDIGYSIKQTTDGGYIVAGYTDSYDGDVTFNHGSGNYYSSSGDYWIVKLNASGNIQWQKTYGGTDIEIAYAIEQAGDGGYIAAGYTYSNDGDVSGNHGFTDCWVVKTDTAGNIQWQKTYGGTLMDFARSIKITGDGGYIMAAYTTSSNGDVTANHGSSDYWVVKINAAGAIQWQKTYGGSGYDNALTVDTTTGGGYFIGGNTYSNNGDVSGNHGATDGWIIKLDATGALLWQKALGGIGDDYAYGLRATANGGCVLTGLRDYLSEYGTNYWTVKLDNAGAITWQLNAGASGGKDVGIGIQQTFDGGFITAGNSNSNEGDVSGNKGTYDCWVAKTDATGAIQWQKALGGSSPDYVHAIRQTSDSGYIVAAETFSNDKDVSGNHGASDAWVVKLNAAGNMIWQKAFGGTGDEYFNDIEQLPDGGYILTGSTTSNNGDVTGNHGNYDYWVAKLDGTGNLQWQKTLGGAGDDKSYRIRPVTDGGYIVAGYTSSNNGDVTGNHGDYDYWIVKLNATGNMIWQKTYGGTKTDKAYFIEQTGDGGYIIAGSASSNDGDVTGHHGGVYDDCWIIKLDAAGTLQWQKALGGSYYDYANCVKNTNDGGYIVGGVTASNDGDVSGNHGYLTSDYWIVKLNSMGTIQWQKAMGGSEDDDAKKILQTADGGLIVIGSSSSNNWDVYSNHGNSDNDYWLVKLASGPLPVTLGDFKAGRVNNEVILNWFTLSESNNKGFNIERCLGASGPFTAVGFIPAKPIGGNSSVRNDYAFTDFNDYQKYSYYRLQQVDKDGHYTYSAVARVNGRSGRLFTISPNPATNIIYINGRALLQVQIFDNAGKLVLTQKISGNNSINIEGFAKGQYILKAAYKDGSVQTERFVKQ